MKIFIAALVLVCASSTNASSLNADCNRIKVFYNSLKQGNAITSGLMNASELRKRFSLVKKFSGGAGGGSVYWVKGREGDRVIKIFPQESFARDYEHNASMREIYFTCLLASEQFSIPNATFSSKDVSFFPQFYGYALTDTATPFEETLPATGQHLMMVFEMIKGNDMFQHSKSSENSPYARKNNVQAILLQIVTALEQVHRKFGFFHRDLHPGNIILSNEKTVSFKKPDGEILTVPMIKIIDFGLSTASPFYAADNIDAVKAANLTLPSSRHFSSVLLDFSTNLRSVFLATVKFSSKANDVARIYPAGDDLQFLNMMIFTFRNTFSSFNNYCRTYQNCIKSLSEFE